MHLAALKHLAGVAMAITRCGRIIVFGSSSLFGSIPEADEEFELIRNSLDADFVLDPFDEAIAKVTHDALGRTSPFEQQFGYHADIVRPLAYENFPDDWETRVVPLAGCKGVLSLEPHDMAVAKLLAGRPKDFNLLTDLIRAGPLDPSIIRDRLRGTAMTEVWIRRTHERLYEIAEAGGHPLPR